MCGQLWPKVFPRNIQKGIKHKKSWTEKWKNEVFIRRVWILNRCQGQSAVLFAAQISVSDLEPAVNQTHVTHGEREKILWVNNAWSNLQLFIWYIDKCQQAAILQPKVNERHEKQNLSVKNLFLFALMLCVLHLLAFW